MDKEQAPKMDSRPFPPSTSSASSTHGAWQPRRAAQEPFARARPWVVASCGLGLGAGFLLATILSVTQALQLPLGVWWLALVQAHGHVQVFGWAGLLVVGVELHFLPRLRGVPLTFPGLSPWLLALLGGGLALRAVSQTALAFAAPGALFWRLALASAGLAEVLGASGVVVILGLTLAHGPSLASRPALRAFLPYALVGLLCFWLALALNAVEGIRLLLTGQSLYSGLMDATIVRLGLFGFLTPLALGMAERALPLYLGLRPFPSRALWLVFAGYVSGLALSLGARWQGDSAWSAALYGVSALLMGGAMLLFIILQGALLPWSWMRLTLPAVQTPRGPVAARPYPVARGNEPATFGPFGWLIRSAFVWLAVAALALCVNGVVQLAAGFAPIDDDAVRHATTAGFVTLLIFGVGQRMLPGFAGRKLLSPRLVTATLWLGGAAAILRVLPVLVGSMMNVFGVGVNPGVIASLLQGAFGLSGPLDLAALLCFTINLWDILRRAPRS